MTELCFNSSRFLKRWFDNLDSIQTKMADMNHLTKTNLQDFSKQTLEELLMPNQPGFDLRKKNLNMHCEQQLGLFVPNDAYDDMKKNYLWFLERVAGVTAQDRLIKLFYCVAHNLNSKAFPSDDQPVNFPSTSLKEAYKNKPFAQNPVLKKLDRLLSDSVNPAFYRDSSALKNGGTTIDQVIKVIMS